MKKFFDRFLERFGLWVVAVALAVLIVLLLNPFPRDLLGTLPIWAYVAPGFLIILFSGLLYLKLKRDKPEKKEVLESGEW